MKNKKTHGSVSAIGILIPIALSFLLFSCRKDNLQVSEPSENTINQCIPLPSAYDNYVGGSMPTLSERPRQLRPCFNPSNSNEIVFQEDSEEGESSVFKYNMLTKEKTLLSQGRLVSQPSWGINDWILLVFYDFNVWRIKSDGTGLEQLTEGGGYYSPKWNADGTYFVTDTPFQPNFSLLHNINGVIIDTIFFNVGNLYTIEKEPLIVCHHPSQYRILDLFLNDIISEYEFHSFWGGANTGSVFWKDNNSLIFSNSDGIFTSDSNYEQVSNLVGACNSVSYSHGDINYEKTQMIWAFSDKEFTSTGILKIKTVLQLMDIEGNVILSNVLEE